MNKYLAYIIVIFSLTSCALPQFSFKSGGGNSQEIDANSVQVDFLKTIVPLEVLFYLPHLLKVLETLCKLKRN